MYDQRKKIFLFTGLGADERAFSYLKFPGDYQIIPVYWLKTEKNESLSSYCRRLIDKYEIRSTDILIGLSFGGIVATKIHILLNSSLTILISSVSTKYELPILYKIAGTLNVNKIIPKSFYNNPDLLKKYFFNLKTEEQTKLFDEILKKSDVDFVSWAIDKILHWNNTERPNRLFKINGSADRILPVKRKNTDFLIISGNHFLTWQKPDEISDIIKGLLKKHSSVA